MNKKRPVWRWLRWVLLVVVGLPTLAFLALVAVALLKPGWLKPAAPPAVARVPLPPPVPAPDSVLGPLHAFGGQAGPGRLLNLAPNALNVYPLLNLHLRLGTPADAQDVSLRGGLVRQELHVLTNGAETVMASAGRFRAGEVLTVRVPGNYLRQFMAHSDPGGAFGLPLTTPIGRQPRLLHLTDADGDGFSDAFVLNLADSTVSVRLNDGYGRFGGGQDWSFYPHHPSDLAVGDLDNDGDADMVTTDTKSPLAWTWLNDGHGSFSQGWGIELGAPRDANGYHTATTLADVDGDGDLDALFAVWNRRGAVTVRLNDGTGAFGGGGRVAVDSYPSAPVLGDVDNDGDLDLVTANYGAVHNSVSVRLNDGQGNFGGGEDVAAGAHPQGVLLADVDGDHDLDVLARDDSHTAHLRLNDGHGHFRQRRSVYLNCALSAFAFGDVDGDGDLDLVGAVQPEVLHQPSRAAIWRNDGHGNLGNHNRNRQDVPLRGYTDSIGLADANADGTVDLLAALPDSLAVYFNRPPR